MRQKSTVTILVICIAFCAALAAATGIFSQSGTGPYIYQTIRGESVTIYGIGLYHHMSADVAIQGIAQDYVTLFIAIPLLLVGLWWARKGSVRAVLFLAGVLNYFLVTYLFYLHMAMFNKMFLVYVILTGTSFFALILTILAIDVSKLPNIFTRKIPNGFIGGFLIFNSVAIALLWLGVVVPPLIDKTIIPAAVEHYTTLTVQGFDLSIFLPVSFVSGMLLIKRKPYGYLMATVTLVFLPLLMTALVAKIIAMAMAQVNVIPVIFIIPCILCVATVCGFLMIRSVQKDVFCGI